MTRILDVFTSWDRMIREGDLCPLIMLIWLLLYLGRFAVNDSPRLQLIGFRIAAGVAFLQAIVDLVAEGLASPAAILLLLIRAIAAGLLTLGTLWISLAALTVVGEQGRGIVRWITSKFIRSRLARQLRKQEALDRERQRLAAIEWERARPERERLAREAAHLAQAQASVARIDENRRSAEKTRRDHARFSVLVVYDRRAAGQGERIPRQRVIGYLDRYLADDLPVEVIEERARVLQQVLEETARGGQTRSQFESLDALAAKFQARRLEIASLPYDEEMKDTLLTSINTQEEASIRELLRP